MRATCRFRTCRLGFPSAEGALRGAIYDGPGGKTGNIVGYGIVCVGIPIGDPAFVKRLLELKEEEIFDKIDQAAQSSYWARRKVTPYSSSLARA